MKFFFKIKTKQVFFLIVVLAGIFRFYGLDWDQGQHLHPDERFLTMVATAVKIPSSLTDYLNPQISTMSPYNNNYSFFVYGTFPLYLTKVVGVLTGNNDYGNIHFVGRILSALFDIGTVFLLFKIGQIFNEKTGLLAAFLYSIMVLPIQLSHFFAVDTFLNFFLVLSFYLLILLFSSNSSFLLSLLLGISFGLALACKISALYFLPIIGLGYLLLLLNNLKKLKHLRLLISGIIFILTSLFVFRFAQPTAFSSGNWLNWQPNPQFINNLKELKSSDNPNSTFPPALQWKSTKPIIFPLTSLILWGLGLPLGVLSVTSFFITTVKLISNLFVHENFKIENLKFKILIFLWVIGLFVYQGTRFTKNMRYFLPIYPFLALLSANFISQVTKSLKAKLSPNIFFIFSFLIFISILVYPISFMSIYFHPITRVAASKWIYENVPSVSIIVNEEWDDGLPLILPNHYPEFYKTTAVFMYDPDTAEKWKRIDPTLEKADYIFLTSNRAYGSTMRLPEKYPQTIDYYQSLFNSSGKFKKVAEFTSRPCFPPTGKYLFCFNDDSAEESFTIYDHPKVMIFKKKDYF